MNLAAISAAIAGVAVTLVLAAARTTFVGWPLHPAAYALAASWEMHLVWMPMLIAWLAKLAITRYGGFRLYHQTLPFFYGLILGESMVGCLWVLAGLVFKLPSYSFF